MTPASRDTPAPEGHRFPSRARVRTATDIRALFSRGKRKRTTHLDVFFLASPALRPRFGLVVPKHRNAIVDRNRLRRRLREIGRIHVLPTLFKAGRNDDVMVRARREAYAASYAQLREELVDVVEKECSGNS